MLKYPMVEFSFSCSQIDERLLELKRTEGKGIPAALLSPYLGSRPLYESLGCFECERLIWECENRLTRSIEVEDALYHDGVQHPGFSQRTIEGFTVFCPLLSKRNVHPSFRENIAPCQTKEQISVNLADEEAKRFLG